MIGAATLLPSAAQTVNIKNEYAPGFLSNITSEIVKDPFDTLVNKILKPLDDQKLTITRNILVGRPNADVNLNLDLGGNDKDATSDMAFITFMLSRYHKEYRKNGNAAKFSVHVGTSRPIEFYCMKGYTYGGEDKYTTDNDMILASILGLNTVVGSLRANNMAGMHPLSRMAVTEDGIASLEDYLVSRQSLSERFMLGHTADKVTAVKLFNTACARKSHQFQGSTVFYYPELAAAQLIMGVMTSKAQSPSLIDITNKNLQKIARAAGSLDRDVVVELMEHCTPPNTAYNAQELFAKYKNKTMAQRIPPYQQSVSALTAFKQPSNLYPEAGYTSQEVGKQPKQGIVKKSSSAEEEMRRLKKEMQLAEQRLKKESSLMAQSSSNKKKNADMKYASQEPTIDADDTQYGDIDDGDDNL